MPCLLIPSSHLVGLGGLGRAQLLAVLVVPDAGWGGTVAAAFPGANAVERYNQFWFLVLN